MRTVTFLFAGLAMLLTFGGQASIASAEEPAVGNLSYSGLG